MGWILRAFHTRRESPMLTLYRSLVIPLLEYCCQLWHPWRPHEAKALEGVQRTFTSKIVSVKMYDYWKRLSFLKLYSLERRRERYIIIYTWKIINGLVPNIDTGGYCMSTKQHPRLGIICNPPKISFRHGRLTTMRHNSLPIIGPRLFNALPRYIRNLNGVSTEAFKRNLDNYLKHIPDEPNIDHYHTPAESNSIVDQLRRLKLDDIVIPVEEATPCPGSP